MKLLVQKINKNCQLPTGRNIKERETNQNPDPGISQLHIDFARKAIRQWSWDGVRWENEAKAATYILKYPEIFFLKNHVDNSILFQRNNVMKKQPFSCTVLTKVG